VKLLGATPTEYCWNLKALDEVCAPQKLPAVRFTPNTLKDLLRQQVPAAVQAEFVEQAAPTEGATTV
jgi:hypothetical protein